MVLAACNSIYLDRFVHKTAIKQFVKYLMLSGILTYSLLLKLHLRAVYNINKLQTYCFMCTCYYKTGSKNSRIYDHYIRQSSKYTTSPIIQIFVHLIM